LVFAPGPFPGNKTVTLESKFDDVEKGIAAAQARAKHPDALAALHDCRAKVRSSYQLYKQGKEVEAGKEIIAADELFVAAGRLRGWNRSSRISPNCNNSNYRLVKSGELRLDGATIMATVPIAPALLVQRFGEPSPGDGYKISGEFVFINDSGEAFALHDWLSTTLYTESGLTPAEFWASTDEMELHVSSPDKDCTSFLEWVANQLG
jgi:hypothetical protein